MMKHAAYIALIYLIPLSVQAQQEPGAYLHARAMMVQGKFDSAIAWFDRAIEKDPADFEALYYRGMARFQLGRYPAAAEDFLTVERRYNGRASFMLAKTEIRLGREELALKFLKDHLSSPNRRPEEIIRLDPDIASLENTPGWRQLWNEKDWYKPFEKELQQARYLMNNGEELEALNLLNALENQGINKTTVHLYKAEIYHRTGNVRAAMNEVNASLKSDYRNREALRLRIGMAMEREDYETASKDLLGLLRQDPAAFDGYLKLGMVQGKLGRYEQAVSDFDLYLALFPEDDSALYLKGVMQQEAGKYLDALVSLNRALELNNGVAAYWSARGAVYAATGMHRYAVRDYGMSLDLTADNADVWYLKGISDMELGHLQTACFCFRKSARYGKFEARAYIEKLCGDR